MSDLQPTNVQTFVPIPAGTPWLSIDEAAAYTRHSRPRIEKFIGAREIPSYKIGGRTLLNKKDLDQWIEKGRRA